MKKMLAVILFMGTSCLFIFAQDKSEATTTDYVACGARTVFVWGSNGAATAFEGLPEGSPVVVEGFDGDRFQVKAQSGQVGYIKKGFVCKKSDYEATMSNSPVISTANSSTADAEPLRTVQPTGRCTKSIAFGVAGPGGVAPGVPKFARKWVKKNAHEYPGLCFSQRVDANAQDYLLVFSTSRSAFSGFEPVVRTSTNTTPVSGSGTVTDDYGGTWDYTFQGTVTTTTTTQENVPYTDTAHTIYLYAYDQRGSIISGRSRTITTRQGGDGANTLGYNLGALLRASIDNRGRLLHAVVDDVYKAAPSAPSMSGSVSGSDFPHTAEVVSAQRLGEDWIVIAKIGQVDYGLEGPQIDIGTYPARLDHQNGGKEVIEILGHDTSGNPVSLSYQVDSEEAY